MFYLVKTPWWLRKIYSNYEWRQSSTGQTLYLTFDDGPHPEITPLVLAELKKYNALATFFCIGKNVAAYPEVYKQIIAAGHSVGNHTYSHYDGWKTADEIYLKDVAEAAALIEGNLFRPPYGHITSFQAKNLKAVMKGRQSRIIMWDVLSGDFDTRLSPQQCLANVILPARSGSIIVFHDSEKASAGMQYALPRVLQYFSEKGYTFSGLD